MERPYLHVCIATGQNLANLIPALQLRAGKVVILETAAMHNSARNLEAALRAHTSRWSAFLSTTARRKASSPLPSVLLFNWARSRLCLTPRAATSS